MSSFIHVHVFDIYLYNDIACDKVLNKKYDGI